MDRPNISRRKFVKACGATAALAAAASGRLVEPTFALDEAPRLKLVDKAGKPIKASALEVHANYIFPYPYVSTPCLLLRLDAATPRNVERINAEKASYTGRAASARTVPSSPIRRSAPICSPMTASTRAS